MVILSLDNATVNCGYALFEDGKLLASGVLKAPAGKLVDKRLELIRDGILGLIARYKVEHIVFEDTMLVQKGHNNLQTFKKLCWLQGMIAAICFEQDIDYTIYLPSEWRSKIGFLKGQSQKREVQKQKAIEFVQNTYSKDVTDDEAEAICIGHTYCQNV